MKNYWETEQEYTPEEYKAAQEHLNKAKINCVWVKEFEVQAMSKWLKKHNPNNSFGVCHGSRNGSEVKMFRKHLGIKVIGTDISDTAKQFDHMIVHDMQEIKDEWVDKADFIYSNSFDHCSHPQKCMQNWLKTLNSKGVIFLHVGGSHFEDERDRFTPGDCFTATRSEYKDLIKKAGGAIIDTIKSKSGRFIWVIGNENH